MIPFQTNAGTIGGWTYSNPISKGASAVISATKNVVINGKDFIKTGSATITPTAAQVAKTFGKTAGALALSVAIEQILGTVDWVLDPENNQIRYKDPDAFNSCTATNSCGVTDYYLFRRTPTVMTYYTSVDAACRAVASSFGQTLVSVEKYYDTYGRVRGAMCRTKRSDGSPDMWSLDSTTNPIYDPNATDQDRQKTIPLSNLASRVIDNAKTGEPKAQAAIMQAATDILSEAETDSTKARPITNQLEQSAETKPADAVDALKQNAGTAKTTNPDGTTAETEFEMPVACTWMPIVCEAASVVINKPAQWAESIKAAYDDAVDYFKSEPEQTDNTLDLGEENQTQPDTTISFQTSCPAKIPLTFNWNGQTLNFSFDFTIWCESISTFVYPIVVALGSLHALYIVAGVRQDG